MLLIDKYAYTNDLKDFNPQAKFIIACGGLLLLRIIDNNMLYILNSIIILISLVTIAKIPFKHYINMFSIPMIFLIISLFTIIISINDTEYLFYINLLNMDIGITKASLIKGKDTLLTVISSISSIYFLILTTPMNQIINGLKKFKIPDLIIELMILIYRSIFIFLGEMENMHLAQTMKFGYENKRNSINSLSLLIGNLFRKIIIKHEEMSIALDCKLYDGTFKTGE